MKGPEIGVVIVAYKSAETIGEAVQSALRDPAVAEIVVVDNSRDRATKWIVEAFGEAVRYFPHGNDGFAAGCNFGWEHVRESTNYVAFVNPDVVLTRSMDSLISILRERPDALVAGETSQSFSSSRRIATPWRELVKSVVGSRAYRQDSRVLSELAEVEQLSGAMIVASNSTIMTLGGFDERFELYYEDVDICRRAAIIGGCWLDTREYGYHQGGVSFSHSTGPAFTALRVSRIRYLRKHFNCWPQEVLIPVIGVVEYVTRSVSRQAEGQSTRNSALRAQIREWHRPMSFSALDRN